MAWSKTTRICVMLGIDICFFLLELIVGLLVHSLALMADAFHMVGPLEGSQTLASSISNFLPKPS